MSKKKKNKQVVLQFEKRIDRGTYLLATSSRKSCDNTHTLDKYPADMACLLKNPVFPILEPAYQNKIHYFL